MKYLLAAWIIASMQSISARGTLVVMVPSDAGLVIAADSRSSPPGSYCDNSFKIIELANPSRTVVTVTGTGIFVDAPPLGEPDLCRYLATARRSLDIGGLVKNYLENKKITDISKLSLEDLGTACATELKRFAAANPLAIQPFIGNEVFSVVIANYTSETKTAMILNFVVRIDAATSEIIADRFTRRTITPIDRRDVLEFGETDYLNKNVYGGARRAFLSAATLGFILANKPVSETPLDQAVAAAANIIEAAGRTTNIVRAPSGIGGPTDIVLLGQKTQPERLRWKSK